MRPHIEPSALDHLAHRLAAITLLAAKPILEIYNRPINAREKSDGSPVTEADLAADLVIRSQLREAYPDIPVVSEESFDMTEDLPQRFFLVDPLDGTKEFIKKTGEFTINIAYIENGESKAGAIFAPALDALFIGGDHAFSLKNIKALPLPDLENFDRIKTRDCAANDLIALASLSHRDPVTESFLDAITPRAVTSSGSSYKFCVVASGNADIYPRVGPTMGWDTAAGQAILEAAGGIVINARGEPMRYTEPSMRNGPFLALGNRELLGAMAQTFTTIIRDQRHAENGAAATK